MLKSLVEAGADINIQSGELKWTPIMKASHNGNIDIVRYLLDHGADIELTDVDGDTSLDLAILRNNTAIIKLLKESSEDYE